MLRTRWINASDFFRTTIPVISSWPTYMKNSDAIRAIDPHRACRDRRSGFLPGQSPSVGKKLLERTWADAIGRQRPFCGARCPSDLCGWSCAPDTCLLTSSARVTHCRIRDHRYSAISAFTGSTAKARLAGTKAPMIPTTKKNTPTPAKVAGSDSVTPNNMERSGRVAASAIG